MTFSLQQMESDEEIPTLIEHKEIPSASLADRVPLTIICGFLGAGKSTLLKRILTERHGYRIAVIMNEFGDTADIESKTINVSSPDDPVAEQSEEILELANGCLCCSIKDTGAAAIEKLMQRKGAFDHILLETTGLADPGPIASIFWHNEEFAAGLGRDIALDGVICVVDAFFGKQQLDEDHSEDHIGESIKQIAGSDVILLNKVDLVAPEALVEVESLIRRVNPTGPIHRTIKGNIDLGLIMGISAFTSPPPLQTSPSAHSHNHDRDHNHDHDHDDPTHTHNKEPTHYELRGISSLQVPCPVLSTKRFAHLDEWIRSVLWDNRIPEELEGGKELLVLRCKGLIQTEVGEQYVLQGVRSMYDMVKVESQKQEEIAVPQVGKIVLIGKGLDERIRRSLENAIGNGI